MIIKPILRVRAIVGLIPPQRRPRAFVFHWTVDGRQPPNFLRFCWHPATGDFLVGVVGRHAMMIPRDDPLRTFYSYQRGFWFPNERIVAIRPFISRCSPYDDYDPQIDRRVTGTLVRLLRRRLRRARFVIGIDNKWLLSEFGHYSGSW